MTRVMRHGGRTWKKQVSSTCFTYADSNRGQLPMLTGTVCMTGRIQEVQAS